MFRRLQELWWRIDVAITLWRVKRDPIARNAEPPSEMYENILRQIQEYETAKKSGQ